MNELKDHVATLVTDSETCAVIDFKNRTGSRNYWIRYIVDKENGTLIISGDLGYSISCWCNPIHLCNLREYVKNIPYWMSKFQCTSDDYKYEFEDVEADLNEIKEKYLSDMKSYDFTEEEIESDFKEMIEICEGLEFSNHKAYPRELVELMEKYDPDWWDSDFCRIGRRISPRVKLWSKGLVEAINQLGL